MTIFDFMNFTNNRAMDMLYDYKDPMSGKTYTIQDVIFECPDTSETRVFDELDIEFFDGGFSATEQKDGTVYYYTVLKTPDGRVLPEHAFIYPVFSVLCLGDVSEGKTCSILSFLSKDVQKILRSSGDFYAINDRNLDCVSADDEAFIKMLKNFENMITPDPTRVGESFKHIDILVKNRGRGMILSLYDISGEDARNTLTTGCAVHNFDEIIYCISAKKLTSNYNILDDQPVLQRFINQQNRRRKNKAMIHVLITQADLILDKETMKKYDTIDFKAGKVLHHEKAFDMGFYYDTEELVKEIISFSNPAIYDLLMTNAREENISFHITAAIGKETEKNKMTEYCPFSPDEVWKYIFARHGMYTMTEDSIEQMEQENLIDRIRSACNF